MLVDFCLLFKLIGCASSIMTVETLEGDKRLKSKCFRPPANATTRVKRFVMGKAEMEGNVCFVRVHLSLLGDQQWQLGHEKCTKVSSDGPNGKQIYFILHSLRYRTFSRRASSTLTSPIPVRVFHHHHQVSLPLPQPVPISLSMVTKVNPFIWIPRRCSILRRKSPCIALPHELKVAS